MPQADAPPNAYTIVNMDPQALRDRCAHLFQAHYDEVIDGDSIRPMAIKWDYFDALAEVGQWQSFVAVDADEPIGYLAMTRQPHLFSGHEVHGFVLALYVAPAHRKRGIYVALCDAAKAWCRDQDITSMLIHAKPGSRLEWILWNHEVRRGMAKVYETIYKKEI